MTRQDFIGRKCSVPCEGAQARGRWWVEIVAVSEDGKFVKVRVKTPHDTNRPFGKPKWYALKDCCWGSVQETKDASAWLADLAYPPAPSPGGAAA